MNLLVKLLLIGAMLSIYALDAASSLAQSQEDPKKKVEIKQDAPKPMVPRVGPQQEAPIAAKIEDMEKHRRRPIPFVRSPDEILQLDLAGVDFDADVLAVIDGVEVTQDLFRAHLVMFLGGLDVDRSVTAILSDIGKEVRIEDGASPEEFAIDEAQVDQLIQMQLTTQAKMQKTPVKSIEEYKEGIEAAFGWERFRDKIRSMIAFEKVYLPDVKVEPGKENEPPKPPANPAEQEPIPLDPKLPVVTDGKGVQVNRLLPEITWNALSQRELDHGLRDMLNEQYLKKMKFNPLLRQNFGRAIKDALLRGLTVEYFYQGNLKPGILLKIEDKELPVEEIYAIVKNKVTDSDRMMALREILVTKAMDRELKEKGFLLSPEDAQAAFSAHQKQYEGTLFTLEFMIQLYGYFNMACYKNLYFRKAGFEKLIADELNNNEILKNYYESAARLLFERGSVKLKIIFFSVYDHKVNKMKEGGFAAAKAKANEAMERLKAGESFNDLAKEYADTQGTFSTYDFQPLNRLYLRKTLGESNKSALISGFSVSDYLFYRAKTDEIVGPIENRWSTIGNPTHQGYFIFKVEEFRRSATLKPFEDSIEMVKTDYSDLKFPHWAQECLKNSSIELTKK